MNKSYSTYITYHFVPRATWLRRLLAAMLIIALGSFGVTAQTFDLARYGIIAAGYSGIAALGEGRYAVVSDMDKGGRIRMWHIDTDGRRVEVKDISNKKQPPAELSALTDLEGICYDSRDTSLWISSEAAGRVVELDLEGMPTGRELPIPSAYGKGHIQPNRGFEALAYDPTRHCLWTCTEAPVRGDSVSRILRFDLPEDATPIAEPITYIYRMDGPQTTESGHSHVHGISAVAVLADGRLLVLEREAFIPDHYLGSKCWCKLFVYDPTTEEKHLATSWTTSFGLLDLSFANYEGMCILPSNDADTPTLLLISDSQGGYGIGRWHLRDYLKLLPLTSEMLR